MSNLLHRLMTKFSFKLSSDKLLGLTAMVISLITLVIFVRQTNIMDEQSKMSVMPYIVVELSDNKGGHQMQFNLVNHGVGPAIVDEFYLKYKGKIYRTEPYKFFKSVSPKMNSLEFLNHTSIYKGIAIPAGGSINVFTVGANEVEYELFKTELAKIRAHSSFQLYFRYKSIYDNTWVINADNGVPLRAD